MRLTRNYMSGLLNGNSSMSGTSSLLQRALSRSSKSKRASRSSLLTNSSKTNNFYSNLVKSTANTQKLYYNMKYHAGQVIDYADKLTDRSDTSLFAKAEESGENAEIVSAVKGFVGQYNSMLQNLKESGKRADDNYVTQFNSISRMNSSELASCGVTRNYDGTLAIDDKKLAATDIETLKKVWGGNSSFAGRAALWADSVESSAERNMKAEASNSYNNLFNNYGSNNYSNLFNNYGNSGNYFNFFR
ncbi:MAG: hypothetical protein K2N77_10180 [Lachnospiraceae bacterium]|nr:hypothetical protein [Lachnospiraceae bacterium]